MILVDTSVWIRSLANRVPYATGMAKLLSLGEVAGHELIYGELLIGDSGGRAKLLALYEQIRFAKTVAHENVLAFVRAHSLSGRGIGWVDAHILASAVAGNIRLWTADTHLAELASEFGVKYEAPPGTIH